ncbi:MAG TPA: dihydrofolate reductase [Povalibacter sp.]|nr:dihydrofolate reductase [Povalibacter sp.]
MTLSIVVAVAENGVIGHGNALPWRLPDDLRRFKELTLGKPIVMGRKTHDSIGRALPGRTNIVVSRQAGLSVPGCLVVGSVAQALAAAGDVPEVVLIGGAELYRAALPAVDTIHLTRVHAAVPGDTFFPALDPAQWRETTVGTHPADERHAYAFSYLTLERIRVSS